MIVKLSLKDFYYTDDELELVDNYRKLSPEDKKKIDTMLSEAYENAKKNPEPTPEEQYVFVRRSRKERLDKNNNCINNQ